MLITNKILAILFFIVVVIQNDRVLTAQQNEFTNWKVAPGKTSGSSGKGIWYRYKEIPNDRFTSEYVYQFLSQAGGPAKVSWSIPYVTKNGNDGNERLSANFKNGSNQVYSSCLLYTSPSPRD